MVLKQEAVQNVLSPNGLRFDQMVIRRKNPIKNLAKVLTRKGLQRKGGNLDAQSLLTPEMIEKWGLTEKWTLSGRAPKFLSPEFENTIVFGSPLVDVAATTELANETVDLCELFLRLTSFQLRLLSKSPLLESIIAKELARRLPDEKTGAKNRVVFGISTGTLDDEVARAIEVHVPPPSERLAALHRLQNNGFRTYGMLCPILPQQDPSAYAKKAMAQIRAEKCEEIWAEPVNCRPRSKKTTSKVPQRDSFEATLEGLINHGLDAEAALFKKVSEDDVAWEQYCRETYEALKSFIPTQSGEKPRMWWMQYPRDCIVIPQYWDKQNDQGVLLLGAIASQYRFAPYRFHKHQLNVPKLLFTLISDSGALSNLVLESFSEKKQLVLHQRQADDPKAVSTLLGGLNAFIKKPIRQPEGKKHSWFKQFVSAGVVPSSESHALHERESSLPELEIVRLNRLLLHDAFPNEINKFKMYVKPNVNHQAVSIVDSNNCTTLKELETFEAIFRNTWPSFVECGRALMTIKERELYQAAGYKEFEVYCRERLECTRSTANRQIAAATVASYLEPIGAKPTTESQIRCLSGLKPEEVREAWKAAQANAGAGKITANIVREATAKYKSPPSQAEKPEPGPQDNPVLSLIDKAVEAAKDGRLTEVVDLLKRLRRLLERRKAESSIGIIDERKAA